MYEDWIWACERDFWPDWLLELPCLIEKSGVKWLIVPIENFMDVDEEAKSSRRLLKLKYTNILFDHYAIWRWKIGCRSKVLWWSDEGGNRSWTVHRLRNVRSRLSIQRPNPQGGEFQTIRTAWTRSHTWHVWVHWGIMPAMRLLLL